MKAVVELEEASKNGKRPLTRHKCASKTALGKACRFPAFRKVDGVWACTHHDPTRAEKRKASSKLAWGVRHGRKRGRPAGGKRAVRTAKSLMDFMLVLRQVIGEVAREEIRAAFEKL